jgi:phosphatidylglycerol---prolipoprotein diacylglyceryl transferase
MKPFWSPWNFPSYATCMALGFLAAFLLARWRAKREGILIRHIENLLLLSILTGVGGAMAFGKIFYEHRSVWDLLKIWEPGGRVYYGGFICAGAALVGYCVIMRLPVLRVLDVSSPAAVLGLALGRLGCFFGGCCWGDICARPEVAARIANPIQRAAVQTIPALSPESFSLAVQFPSNSLPYQQHAGLNLLANDAAHSLPVHPVQLYETAATLALCWYLHRSFAVPGGDGRVFARLLAGYAAIRFGLEFFRADNPPVYAALTVSQVTALWLALLAAVLWWFTTRKGRSHRRTGRPAVQRDAS